MPRETDAVRLLRTLLGLHRLRGSETLRFAEVVKLNKLYLICLRRVGGSLRDELIREMLRTGGL
jgi:hypothetical protein